MSEKRKVLNWRMLKADLLLVEKIVQRADHLVTAKSLLRYSSENLLMDLMALHCNTCPLELEELLAADVVEFMHDVWGICRYLDRDTGGLRENFRPRFAKDKIAVPEHG